MAQLKKELKDLKVAHAKELRDVRSSVSEEKDRLEGQVQKYKDLAEAAEKKTKAWISQLNKINSEMSSKIFLPRTFHLSAYTGACFNSAYFLLSSSELSSLCPLCLDNR